MRWVSVDLIEYRTLPHTPGARRWSKAFVLDHADPREALPAVLGIPATAVEVKGDPEPVTNPEPELDEDLA